MMRAWAAQPRTTKVLVGLFAIFLILFLLANRRELVFLIDFTGDDLPGESDFLALSNSAVVPSEADIEASGPPTPATNFHLDDSNPAQATWRNNAGVHLVTSFFKGTYRPKRVAELVEALRRNVANPAFEAVHVLWEDVNPRDELGMPNEPRLVTMKVKHQPTYQKFFMYSNIFLKRGAIVIIANSDLYFDNSLAKLRFGAPDNRSDWRSAMALSRRHAPECGEKNDWRGTYDLCEHYIGSHDAFVFAPPVPEFVVRETKHTQNHFGAENIVVWAFLWAKYFRGHVTNPCQRIRAFHLHCVPERHYTVGSFISYGRHGNVRPGVDGSAQATWNLIA